MSTLIRSIAIEASNANNGHPCLSNPNITKPVYAPSTPTVKDIPVMTTTSAAVPEPSISMGASTASSWTSNPSALSVPYIPTTQSTDGKPQRFVSALPLKSSDNNVALLAELLRAKRAKEEKAAAALEEKSRNIPEQQISKEKENISTKSTSVPSVNDKNGIYTAPNIRANGPVYRASGPNRNVGFSTYNPVPACGTGTVTEGAPTSMRHSYVDASAGNTSAGHSLGSHVSVGRLTIPKVVMCDEGQYNPSQRSVTSLDNHLGDRPRQVPLGVKDSRMNNVTSVVSNPYNTSANFRQGGNIDDERYMNGEKSEDTYRSDAYPEAKHNHHMMSSNLSGVYEGTWDGAGRNGAYPHRQKAPYVYNETPNGIPTGIDGSHHTPVSVSVGTRDSKMRKVYVPHQQQYCHKDTNTNTVRNDNVVYRDGQMEETHTVGKGPACKLPDADSAIDYGNSDDYHDPSIVYKEPAQPKASNVEKSASPAPAHNPNKKFFTPQKSNKGSPKNNNKHRFNFAPVGKLFESPGGISLRCSPSAKVVPHHSPMYKGTPFKDTPVSKEKKQINFGSDKKPSSPIIDSLIKLSNSTNTSNNIPTGMGRKGAQKTSAHPAPKPNNNNNNNNNKRKVRYDDSVTTGQRTSNGGCNSPAADGQEMDILSFFASSPEILKSAVIKPRNTKKNAAGSSPPASGAEQTTNHKTSNHGSKPVEADTKYYVEVERHHSMKLYVYAYNIPSLREGAYVIFEGDRGEDMGRVISYSAAPTDTLVSNPKQTPTAMVIRIANEEEVALWRGPQLDEAKEAVDTCSKCVKRHLLPLTIVAAAFQFDRKKLTIYYRTAANRVDFRKMVMDLHNNFHCRIWMERIEGNSEFFE
eukprot:Tbor_TRINITY_DN5551_c4_g1::TRINITY_DN5551_c4_g1_i1::g.12741::m.12741